MWSNIHHSKISRPIRTCVHARIQNNCCYCCLRWSWPDTHLRERPRTKIKPCHTAHWTVNCKNLYLVANIIYIQLRNYVYSTPLRYELCSWWNTSDKAKSNIGRENIWILILEAFKILNHKKPPPKCRNIYERTFNLSYLSLHTLFSNIEKTNTFKNWIDYLLWIYKIKY